MPMTPREFRRRIEDTQDDMRSQYNAPFCEIAHQEFEIPQTPLPDDERDSIRESWGAHGISIPDDSIKLTEEHRDFHEGLRRIVIGFQADGADATQLLSAGLAVGRRMGMADAVALMNDQRGPGANDPTPWNDER